jgi:hypothetical protein
MKQEKRILEIAQVKKVDRIIIVKMRQHL